MIRINQITLALDEDKELLKEKISQKYHIPIEDIEYIQIYRESIDARKQGVNFSYSVDVKVKDEQRYLRHKDIVETPQLTYIYPQHGEKKQSRIVIAGFGPAGMFAALLFAQMGYCPYVVERGGDVDDRVEKVEAFWKDGILDVACNVQFGEGGAGTFSDGKLTTRSKDLRSRKVLEELVKFGAPKEILYQAHPHIGTDLLRGIVKNIREEIIRLGGSIHFYTQLHDLKINGDCIEAVQVNNEWIECDAVLMAVGHSARDTFSLLHDQGVEMEAKAFAVGVRVEHPQALINKTQYKEYANHPKLKAAEYRFAHTTKEGRGVYTFCMCPGGTVVASASMAGGLVVNGMSEYARDQENANSAVLVQVQPSDYGEGVLDGIAFQKELEEKAFILGGRSYLAPVQRMEDYLNGWPSTKLGSVQPTYQPGVKLCNLRDIFPSYINDALCEGLEAFERKLKGYTMPDAILCGVETRSSSPVRVLRDRESLNSINVRNLFPCGEGAGYAGGIVSAAIDGIRCAEKIIEQYAPIK